MGSGPEKKCMACKRSHMAYPESRFQQIYYEYVTRQMAINGHQSMANMVDYWLYTGYGSHDSKSPPVRQMVPYDGAVHMACMAYG